jgi:hypothetical protein
VVVTLHPQARARNRNAVVHGAKSPTQIAAKARNHKRRFLRRAGIKAGDLDAVALELLNLYSRGCAQLDLREAGGVDSGKDYWTAYNGTRRVLERLDRRLRRRARSRARERLGRRRSGRGGLPAK